MYIIMYILNGLNIFHGCSKCSDLHVLTGSLQVGMSLINADRCLW